MELKELLDFIRDQDEKIKNKPVNASATRKERVLGRTVKVTEELGELCDAILAADGDQRKEKLEKSSKENLEGEFADVIITTLLLAHSLGVDIEEALSKKVEMINKRHV